MSRKGFMLAVFLSTFYIADPCVLMNASESALSNCAFSFSCPNERNINKSLIQCAECTLLCDDYINVSRCLFSGHLQKPCLGFITATILPTSTTPSMPPVLDETKASSTLVIASCLISLLVVVVIMALTLAKMCRRPPLRATQRSPTMHYELTMTNPSSASFYNSVTEYLRVAHNNNNDTSVYVLPEPIKPPSYEEVISQTNTGSNQDITPPPSYEETFKTGLNVAEV